jgi:RNA polymerase-binding transcription factor DksA
MTVLDVTTPRPRPGTAADTSWRALLEGRWRDRLQELTDICLAFHEAGMGSPAAEPRMSLRMLSRRAAAARHALAETDQALSRLSAGEIGRCEDCAGEIPASQLRQTPEARFCRQCAA